MSDFLTVANDHTELEARAGVDALAVLHARRRELRAALAPLDLLFANQQKGWESARKRHRAVISQLIANETTDEKMAENKLERLANADPRHTKFVDETESKFSAWSMLSNELDEVNERIESRKAELYFVGAEVRMTP